MANHVSMVGTTDIPSMRNVEIGGTLHTNVDEWWERSPVKHLPNVITLVMMEYHDGDLRCPITQAEEILQHLKLLGKEVEFLRYPGGPHMMDLHAPSQDVDYMERANAWFASRRGTVPPAGRRSRRGTHWKPGAGRGASSV